MNVADSKSVLTDSVDPTLIPSSSTVTDPIELYHSDERGEETPVQLSSAIIMNERETLFKDEIT